MPTKYRNLIIFLALLIGGVGAFLYQIAQNPYGDLFSLPEDVVLTKTQQEKFDNAKSILEKNPKDANAIIAIAQVKYAVQDLEGAEKAYLMALELQPTNTLTLNNLGDIYYQQKQYQKSEEMFLRIIDNNPKWINAYRNLSSIYRYHIKDKYPDMEEILLKGIEKNKELTGEAPVDFYSMIGVFYQETNQIEKAIENYEKVLELDPTNEGARIELERLKQSNQ